MPLRYTLFSYEILDRCRNRIKLFIVQLLHIGNYRIELWRVRRFHIQELARRHSKLFADIENTLKWRFWFSAFNASQEYIQRVLFDTVQTSICILPLLLLYVKKYFNASIFRLFYCFFRWFVFQRTSRTLPYVHYLRKQLVLIIF